MLGEVVVLSLEEVVDLDHVGTGADVVVWLVTGVRLVSALEVVVGVSNWLGVVNFKPFSGLILNLIDIFLDVTRVLIQKSLNNWALIVVVSLPHHITNKVVNCKSVNEFPSEWNVKLDHSSRSRDNLVRKPQTSVLANEFSSFLFLVKSVKSHSVLQ